METELMITLDQKAYDECLDRLRVLTVETQNANFAMKEFAATFESLRARFHPFVWWILTIIGKRAE